MTPQQDINRLIRLYGMAVMGSHNRYNFAYTIGLTEQKLPELIVFGPSMQTSHIILNVAAEIMKQRGEFKDGDITDEIGTLPNGFKEVTARSVSMYACQALYRYENRPEVPRFLQLVIPDRAGKLPWQKGYDAAHMNEHQPQLWAK